MGSQCGCCAVEASISSHEERLTGRGSWSSGAPSAPRPETIEHIDEVYQLDIRQEGILGHSSIGSVVKTRHRKSKALYAVKQMSKKSIELSGVQEEVQALKTLDHPNICKINESWEDTVNVYLIMEFCKGGNLMTMGSGRSTASVNESSIAVLVRQMVSAVSHLHKHNMVHSDIRPENWLFETPCNGEQTPLDMNLKMIDFGLANKHGKRSRRGSDPPTPMSSVMSRIPAEAPGRRISGSGQSPALEEHRALYCKSPEQLGTVGMPKLSEEQTQDDSEAVSKTEKSDVWALGVISYFLLSGQSPFQWAAYKEDLVRRAKYTFMPQELWRPVSSEAKNFIAMCLQRDPSQRPTSEKALALPWMRLANAAADQAGHSRVNSSSASSNGSGQTSKLSIMDPPLETADKILTAFDRMHRLNALEKACVITAAHRISAEKIHELSVKLASFDTNRTGTISSGQLFEGLHSCGVPMSDLMNMAKDYTKHGCVIDYPEFVNNVLEFQRNLQDSVVRAVFRSFDGDGGSTVTKRELWETMKEDDRQKTVREKFPGIGLEIVMEKLAADGSGPISADEFKQLLRSYRRSTSKEGVDSQNDEFIY